MAGEVKIFDATDALSLGGSDWEVQAGPNPTLTKNRAQALDRNGDEFAHRQYGGKYTASFSYVAKKVTGYLPVPAAGAVIDGWHIDGWTVAYGNEAFPTLSVDCHKHDTSLGGVLDSGCRQYEPSFKVPACWGVPAKIEGAASGVTVFELKASAVVGLRSLSLQLAVNHEDVPGREGEHFASDNRDGTETLSVEFTGDVDLSADATLSADWTDDTLAKSGGNAAVTYSTLTATHHVTKKTSTVATE